ncbi:MAG: hypothetical protein COA45_12175 [Zetaproteobacteria bacterium]|nr:MAG: hypothetical protein COA45_12175 [Zetaproteobacteria bacterium]
MAKKTVLVIDDDEVLLSTIQPMLEKGGFSVVTENSGSGGFDAIRYSLPDLIILDTIMPEMDGIEFLGQLKSQVRTKNIPVIMLSADANAHNVSTCMALGAKYYMAKPFDRDKLVECVRKLVC